MAGDDRHATVVGYMQHRLDADKHIADWLAGIAKLCDASEALHLQISIVQPFVHADFVGRPAQRRATVFGVKTL